MGHIDTAEQSDPTQAPSDPRGHDWRQAGQAWGHAARDWACLYEHYAFEVIAAMFAGIGVAPGVSVLDIACGSGLAVRHAHAIGARVAGIDASAELVAIACARTSNADVRLGSMFDLPWESASFDAVVSVNGIWGGCEAALDEAIRVMRPGARVAISFWGNGQPLDLRACFKVFARHAPEQHFGSMKRLNNISQPGVAEKMLEDSGFVVIERGQRVSTIEWPDADIACRALLSVGPAVPAMRHGDPAAIRSDLVDALAPCRQDDGSYRFCNDHQFVIATKP